jgi:cutinase
MSLLPSPQRCLLTQDKGNVGFLAGPPLFAALETYVNGTSAIAVQGISYKSKGSSSSPDRGPALMVDFAQRTAAACPNTRIAMAGYSIGAVVVRSALEHMGSAGVGSINSVVLFGDPREGQPVPAVDAGRVATFCHEGDLICRRSLERQNNGTATPGAAVPPQDLAGEQDDRTGTDGRQNMLGAHLDYGIDAPAAAMFVMQRSGLGVASADAMNQGMEGTLAGMVQDIARNGVDGIGG